MGFYPVKMQTNLKQVQVWYKQLLQADHYQQLLVIVFRRAVKNSFSDRAYHSPKDFIWEWVSLFRSFPGILQ